MMSNPNPTHKSITILMADDDVDDRVLTQAAFEENHLINVLRFVEDGAELMDYLHRRGSYADPLLSPRPGLILLDLNMPKKDGRECLIEIKSSPQLRSIPVVILTTSAAEEDRVRSYEEGANTFIRKSVTFVDLVKVVASLNLYWFCIAELPPEIT